MAALFVFELFPIYHIINIVTIYDNMILWFCFWAVALPFGGRGALSPFEKSMAGTGSRPTLEMQDGPLRSCSMV